MRQPLSGVACAIVVGIVLSSVAVAAQGRGKGERTAQPRPAAEQPHSHATHATTSVHFEIEHVRAIRAHYAPQRRDLPPGLQKKYARTGQLPPGWEKKMAPLPVAIERQLPPLPSGYRRGVIDGHAVIYSSRSGTIIDVAVLF